ncbi:MAG: hypothetical protein Fur0011_2260 [Candidatus Microgenomates bacterium]
MNIKTLLTFMGVTIGILVGVGALLWQFGSATAKPLTDVAGDMRLKRGEGSVVVVEFSDFQCPACAAVHEPLKQVLAKYEGKVSYVHRHFPLTSIHKNALSASQAAESAYNQGKFFEYGDVLFAKQAEWEGLADPSEKYIVYAKELGLDAEKFEADYKSREVADRVSADMVYANRHALSGTPTFFVDGVQLDFTNLEAKLAELTK